MGTFQQLQDKASPLSPPRCHHPALLAPCWPLGAAAGQWSLIFKSINGDLCRGSAAQGTLYVSLPQPPTCSPSRPSKIRVFPRLGFMDALRVL